MKAIDDEMTRHGLENPFAERLKSWVFNDEDAKRLTTRVQCADYFPVRDEALLAHSTQIDPHGFWFAIPHEVQEAAWPTEDFELVKSVVETSIPEDDLFAGLR